MATINAIGSNKPIEVAFGGTGNATLTNHGVLVGATTSAITQLAVGSTGTLLVGASAADPAFGTSANGDFTFTSSTAGGTRTLTVSNTDNTNAASKALVQVTTGGASSGDPATTYTITGATSFTVGVDNSASDAYKISGSTALGTTDTFVMSTAGELTMPLLPAFLAYIGSNVNNVTGNNTTFTLGTTTAFTEVFDQGSDFDTAGTFTSPVTGRYYLSGGCVITGCTIAGTYSLQLVSSNRNYSCAYGRANSALDFGGTITTLADMDAADTCQLKITVGGEVGDTDDVLGGSTLSTYYSGYLAC